MVTYWHLVKVLLTSELNHLSPKDLFLLPLQSITSNASCCKLVLVHILQVQVDYLRLSTDNWHWDLYWCIHIDLGPLWGFHSKQIGASLIGFSLRNLQTLPTKLLSKRLLQAGTGKNCGFGYKWLHSEVKFKVTCRGPEAKPTSSPQSIFGWLSAQSLAGGQTKSSGKCLRQRHVFFFFFFSRLVYQLSR